MNKPLVMLTLLTGFWIADSCQLLALEQQDLPGGQAAASSVEERRIESSIQKEVARLRQKEKMLEMREMELKTLSREVDKKLADLEKERVVLTDLLKQKRQIENDKALELSKIYERMDPLRAAQLLTSLEKDLAVSIIEGMNSKRAGRVLNSMEPEIAATLSQSYASLEDR